MTTMTTPQNLSDEEIAILYGILRSHLNELPLKDIRNSAAAAGIDVTALPIGDDAQRRNAVMPSIDHAFGKMASGRRVIALCILAERLVADNPTLAAEVQKVLGKHGFQYLDGAFVPVGVLDAREAVHLPTRSASELARAAARLAAGDLSGAVTSACGAVDLATQHVYAMQGLGNPGGDSFSARVRRSFKALRIGDGLQSELKALGMSERDATEAATQTLRSAEHAADALQVLRRAMGDTHGSRPAVAAVAYNTVKMSSAICGLLFGKVP